MWHGRALHCRAHLHERDVPSDGVVWCGADLVRRGVCVLHRAELPREPDHALVLRGNRRYVLGLPRLLRLDAVLERPLSVSNRLADLP